LLSIPLIQIISRLDYYYFFLLSPSLERVEKDRERERNRKKIENKLSVVQLYNLEFFQEFIDPIEDSKIREQKFPQKINPFAPIVTDSLSLSLPICLSIYFNLFQFELIRIFNLKQFSFKFFINQMGEGKCLPFH